MVTKISSFHKGLELIAELIFPQACCVCMKPNTLFCDECKTLIRRTDAATACTNCGAAFGYLTCTECKKESWEFDMLMSCASYEHPLDLLVKSYKDKGEQGLSKEIAQLMHEAYLSHAAFRPELINIEAMCYIPATPKAYRLRGFDHMRKIAQDFSDLSKLELINCFYKESRLDQRSLGREERKENAAQSLHIKDARTAASLDNKQLLLIDDVLTTGATLREGAALLKEAGAKAVFGLVLARVW